MKLRFLGGRYQGRIIDLKADGFLLGRGTDCDLVLDEDGVSRRHCRFMELGGKWVVEDLQSTNGVRVNGERIENTRALKTGDHVAVHDVLLLFTDGSDIVDSAILEQRVADSKRAEPAASARAEEVTVSQESEHDEESIQIPWFRLMLLLVLVGILGWLVYKTLGPPDSDESTGEMADVVSAVDDPTAGPKFSDAELEKLMASVEDAEDETTRPEQPGTEFVTVEQPGAPGPRPDAAVAMAPAAEPPRLTAVGMAVITSEPSGASVLINDEEVGITPLVVKDLPEGRHRVMLRKEGYEDFQRQIHMPEVLPDRPYALRQQPGTLMIASEPLGVAVWHGSQILGHSPLMLTDLGAGEHELRFTSAGFEPQKQTVTISTIRGTALDLKLASLTGDIEIMTTPPGCRILVDGLYKGTTVLGDAEARRSKPLRLRGFPEGEHHVAIEHPNGAPNRGTVRVVRGETTPVAVTIWIVDTKVVLTDGTTHYGMLVEKDRHGDILLSLAPKNFKRYYSVQIAEMHEVGPEEAQDVLAKLRGAAPAGRTDPRTPGPRNPAEATVPQVAERADARPPDEAFIERLDGGTTDEVVRMSTEDVRNAFKESTATELDRKFQNRNIAVTGVPTAFGRDGFGGYVSLGPRVRCFFSRDFNQQLKEAEDAGTALTIVGRAIGVRNSILVLRDCRLEEQRPE